MLTDTQMMPSEASDALRSAGHYLNQLVHSVITRASQISCCLTGHAALLRYESRRLSLQCTHCGHESPGWDLCSTGTQK